MEDYNIGNWRLTPEYQSFEKNLLRKPGAHLLGLGKTGSGKTMKAVILAKWCLDMGKTVVWFDSYKPDEVIYLLDFAKEATLFYPGKLGCSVEINPSPPSLQYISIEDPKTLFRTIKPGLNILCIRPFFTEVPPATKYLSIVMHGLINDAYRKKIATKPLQLFMDEFQFVCPTKRIQEAPRSQQELGSRIANAIYQFRSIGVGFCAFAQSYHNLLPAIRQQFDYYLIGKDPDGDVNDYIGKKLLRYANMFANFDPDTAVLMNRNRRWKDRIHWPMPRRPEEMMIEYGGFIMPRDPEATKASINFKQETILKINNMGVPFSDFVRGAVEEKLLNIQ